MLSLARPDLDESCVSLKGKVSVAITVVEGAELGRKNNKTAL